MNTEVWVFCVVPAKTHMCCCCRGMRSTATISVGFKLNKGSSDMHFKAQTPICTIGATMHEYKVCQHLKIESGERDTGSSCGSKLCLALLPAIRAWSTLQSLVHLALPAAYSTPTSEPLVTFFFFHGCYLSVIPKQKRCAGLWNGSGCVD